MNDAFSAETGFLIGRSIGDQYRFKRATVTESNEITFSEPLKAEGDSLFYRVSAITAEGLTWYSNIKGIFAPVYKPENLQAQLANGICVKL